MSYVTEKTIYKLQDKGSTTGFEVTITDDGVDVETVNGMDVIQFINAFDILLVTLKEKYQYGDGP